MTVWIREVGWLETKGVIGSPCLGLVLWLFFGDVGGDVGLYPVHPLLLGLALENSIPPSYWMVCYY